MAKSNLKLIQSKNSIMDEIMDRVELITLGNSKRGSKELASDLVNDFGRDKIGRIAAGTFLCPSTIERVAECEPRYRPQAETTERILRYFGMEAHYSQVKVKNKFQNKPKED